MQRAVVIFCVLAPIGVLFADYSPRDPFQLTSDPIGDAAVRRTDAGANDAVGDATEHHRPDVIAVQMGNWQPFDPAADLYQGDWLTTGQFLRLDIRFDGLVNPPGTLGLDGTPFEPFLYGPHPVFGHIEIDMDASVMTGGETWAPGDRYLGNVARFGGKPAGPRFADRTALSGADLLNPFGAAPFVQRSGEEFHVPFLGHEITSIVVLNGNFNAVFEAGEIWLVRGTLFHLAHGYEEFLFQPPATYEPTVELRWSHRPAQGCTEVTLVYPLTNEAWIAASGMPQSVVINHDPADQNSVFEALNWLAFSALHASAIQRSDPEWPIVADWEFKNPNACLHVPAWSVTILVGMSYIAPADGGALYAWTDVVPDALAGDVNGDGVADATDVGLIAGYIQAHDGDVTTDADASVNGAVGITDFGWNFSVFDANYDGIVDNADKYQVVILGDMDADFDVDMDDVDDFVVAVIEQLSPSPALDWSSLLRRGDFTGDGLLDGRDISGFVGRLIAGSSGTGSG
jgi:hypothetical protein